MSVIQTQCFCTTMNTIISSCSQAKKENVLFPLIPTKSIRIGRLADFFRVIRVKIDWGQKGSTPKKNWVSFWKP